MYVPNFWHSASSGPLALPISSALNGQIYTSGQVSSWYLDSLDQQTSWMIISGLAIYLMVAMRMCVVPVLALIWIMAWLRYIPYGVWEMFLKSIVSYNSALTCSTSFFAAAELFWESSWICIPSWNFQQVP